MKALLILALALAVAQADSCRPVVPTPRLVTVVTSLATNFTSCDDIAAAFGVPDIAAANSYNVVVVGDWLSADAQSPANVWSSIGNYCGKATADVQKAWISAFHAANKVVLLSAHIDASSGDAKDVAMKLSAFAALNNFDGVDIHFDKWSDICTSTPTKSYFVSLVGAVRAILGETRIITFTTHAKFFQSWFIPGQPCSYYAPDAANFLGTANAVAGFVDWFNVQYFIEDSFADYNSMFQLWNTYMNSVAQLAYWGLPADKIVIGKPVSAADGNGYLDAAAFRAILIQGAKALNWSAGVALYSYANDAQGVYVSQIADFATAAAAQN